MDWFQPMDIYCERLGPGFWAEPLNAWSNASFLVAAALALYFALRSNRAGPVNLTLIALAALIGVGSFLFHTFANRWSDIADIVPIWTFMFAYVLVVMHDFFGLDWPRIARIGAIVVVVTVAVFWFMPAGVDSNESPLNGSEQYAPAVFALLAFAIALQVRRHAAAPYAWTATVTFLISLVFRTLDMALCPALPIGTHFGWHLCNGVLVGLLLVALVRHGDAAPKAIRPEAV